MAKKHRINKNAFMALTDLVRRSDGAFDLNNLKSTITSSYRSPLHQVVVYLNKNYEANITNLADIDKITSEINKLLINEGKKINPVNSNQLDVWLDTDEAKGLLKKFDIPLTSHHIDGGALDFSQDDPEVRNFINFMLTDEGKTWRKDYNIEFYYPSMDYENFKDVMSEEKFNKMRDLHQDHVHVGFRGKDLTGNPIELTWERGGLSTAMFSNLFDENMDTDGLLYVDSDIFNNIKETQEKFKNFTDNYNNLGEFRDFVETQMNKNDPNYSMYYIDEDNDKGLNKGFYMKLNSQDGPKLYPISDKAIQTGNFMDGSLVAHHINKDVSAIEDWNEQINALIDQPEINEIERGLFNIKSQNIQRKDRAAFKNKNYDAINNVWETFLDYKDIDGATFRSYLGTDKEDELFNIFTDGITHNKLKQSNYFRNKYGDEYIKSFALPGRTGGTSKYVFGPGARAFVENNMNIGDKATWGLDAANNYTTKKNIKHFVNTYKKVNDLNTDLINKKNEFGYIDISQVIDFNNIFDPGNDTYDFTPTTSKTKSTEFKIKLPNGDIHTIKIKGKEGINTKDIRDFGDVNKWLGKYTKGNNFYTNKLNPDVQNLYDIENLQDLLDAGLNETDIWRATGIFMSPLQLTNTGDEKMPNYIFGDQDNNFFSSSLNGWNIVGGTPVGQDPNYNYINRNFNIVSDTEDDPIITNTDGVLSDANPSDDPNSQQGATNFGAKLGNFMKGMGGPTGLIAMALGIKGYQEANKKIRPLEQPGLSPLFKKHLFQSQELAKTGFDPAQKRQIQQQIDDSYNTGLDNLIRGTSGDRAKFLAGSGVLDAQKSSALLEFAAKDADQKRANQENFYKMLEFKETFEQSKSAEERKLDLEQQLADKKGAAEMGNAAFSYLANAWNTNNGFLSASNARAMAGLNPYGAYTSSILNTGQNEN